MEQNLKDLLMSSSIDDVFLGIEILHTNGETEYFDYKNKHIGLPWSLFNIIDKNENFKNVNLHELVINYIHERKYQLNEP